MLKRAIILAAACLVLASFPSAVMAQTAQPEDSLAFKRAQRLQRGVNASIWFAQSPRDYSVNRLRTFTTPEDIALMEQMGLDHVRLSIDADPLVAWQRAGSDTPFMTELDRVVQTILAHHMSVIVDIHPESGYKKPLLSGTSSVQHFTALWRSVAQHFASTDPEHVFFEIMNEPEQDDPYRWQGIESTVADAIRKVAPNHTIIAAGAHYSGVQDLLMLEPIDQTNIIYTFHDYEPFAFTHQGATWTSPEVLPLRGIPYPSSLQDVAPMLDQEPDLEGRFFLNQYAVGHWDAERIANLVGFAALWSQAHHAPVYCGEFGALRAYSNPDMRAAWLHDTRTALEKDHIGWAMWDYQTNFGMVTKSNGVTTPDSQVLKALGLHDPSNSTRTSKANPPKATPPEKSTPADKATATAK